MYNKNFNEAIRSGKFSEAKTLISMSDSPRLYDSLMNLGFEDRMDISPYLFVLDLLLSEESAELHSIASALLSNPFCALPGAYAVSMQHMQRAIELNPNVLAYKQSMLLFYEIPERLLPLDEALKYAQEVKKADPKNQTAEHFLKRWK